MNKSKEALADKLSEAIALNLSCLAVIKTCLESGFTDTRIGRGDFVSSLIVILITAGKQRGGFTFLVVNRPTGFMQLS